MIHSQDFEKSIPYLLAAIDPTISNGRFEEENNLNLTKPLVPEYGRNISSVLQEGFNDYAPRLSKEFQANLLQFANKEFSTMFDILSQEVITKVVEVISLELIAFYNGMEFISRALANDKTIDSSFFKSSMKILWDESLSIIVYYNGTNDEYGFNIPEYIKTRNFCREGKNSQFFNKINGRILKRVTKPEKITFYGGVEEKSHQYLYKKLGAIIKHDQLLYNNDIDYYWQTDVEFHGLLMKFKAARAIGDEYFARFFMAEIIEVVRMKTGEKNVRKIMRNLK